MSDNNSVTADASIEAIDGIGSTRAEQLPVDTVEVLAESSAQHLANQVDEISPGTIENIVESARDACESYDAEISATVYTKDTEDDDDDDDGAEIVRETFDDPEAFVEAGETAEGLIPQDCETIAVIAGDDAFDPGGKHGDKSAEEVAKHIQTKIVGFGFHNAETIIAPDSGMGRGALNQWVSWTVNNADVELPEMAQISVEPDGRYASRADYENRRERIIEAVDAVCVVANGDYVGIWVNEVRKRPDDEVIIRTPEMEDDE